MTLGQLIKTLKTQPRNKVVKYGFKFPHSYRGYYDQLAFEPAENVSVKDMLRDAKSALGKTFTGWKGGEFTMHPYTDVWLANQGECGEMITRYGLAFMLELDEPPNEQPYE